MFVQFPNITQKVNIHLFQFPNITQQVNIHFFNFRISLQNEYSLFQFPDITQKVNINLLTPQKMNPSKMNL